MNLTYFKKIYLYIVSLISLVILVVASIMLVNLALKTWIFTEADMAYYYPARINCEPIINPDSTITTPRDPMCADENSIDQQLEEHKRNSKASNQRQASQAIAMILVAIPVFAYHWKLTRNETN